MKPLSYIVWSVLPEPVKEAGSYRFEERGPAGLQLLEALRLTWDRVDLERGLVEISGEVKNEYRNRVIPICKKVQDALLCAKSRAEEGAAKETDVVVVGERGFPYADFTSYSTRMRKALRAWNPTCSWAPKDLRNCLPSFATAEGIQGTVWEQYIGHAPKSVTDRHYVPRLASNTSGEERALEKQIALFRQLVIRPLEDAIYNFLQPRQSEPERRIAQVV